MREALVRESGSGRIDYVDNLRVFLTVLVVCHHQAIAFGAPGGWYYIATAPKDIPSLALMTMFVAINQAFFMSLFFFVSAYFTPISMDKKGARRFVRDRLMRLGIPLVVYFFLISPSVVYLGEFFSGRGGAGYFAFMANSGPYCFGVGPMWFVFALLIFTAVYLTARALSRGGEVRRVPLPGNRAVLAFIVFAGAAAFLVRLACPTGEEFLGLQLGFFPLYVCMFVFGILAYRWSWLDQLSKRQANLWFRVSLVAICAQPVIAILGGAAENARLFSGGFTWQAYGYAAWEPFVCVGVCMKLLVYFRERFNRKSALTARLSKSAYTVYILHPFFVVAATGLAEDLPLPPLAIVLIVCPLVLIATFACADFVRRAPLLNKVL